MITDHQNLRTVFEIETSTEVSSSELMEKKSSLRAITLKRENLASEIGYRVRDTLPSYPFWVMDQVDFDDPRLEDIKEEFFETESKRAKLAREVSRMEAIEEDELPRYEAREKAYAFLNSLSDEEAIRFLKQHRLNTVR